MLLCLQCRRGGGGCPVPLQVPAPWGRMLGFPTFGSAMFSWKGVQGCLAEHHVPVLFCVSLCVYLSENRVMAAMTGVLSDHREEPTLLPPSLSAPFACTQSIPVRPFLVRQEALTGSCSALFSCTPLSLSLCLSPFLCVSVSVSF